MLLLPGVALLVLSTSTRFGQLLDEFHRQEGRGREHALKHLRRRGRLLRNALVSLYISVALLVVASVVGTITSRLIGSASDVAAVMTVLGVVSVAFAALQLIRESFILMSVIEDDGESAK